MGSHPSPKPLARRLVPKLAAIIPTKRLAGQFHVNIVMFRRRGAGGTQVDASSVRLTWAGRRLTCGVMEPFWKTKTLETMSASEWESLCDGCGKCCMSKLEDEDTGEIHWTSVACRLFDEQGCRCQDYENRLSLVDDCVGLNPENVMTLSWLPSTCAYRLVAEGRDLYWWHPLVSGDPNTVHAAGISMRGRVVASESDLEDPSDYFDYVLDEEP